MFNSSYLSEKNKNYTISPFVHSYFIQTDISRKFQLKLFCEEL